MELISIALDFVPMHPRGVFSSQCFSTCTRNTEPQWTQLKTPEVNRWHDCNGKSILTFQKEIESSIGAADHLLHLHYSMCFVQIHRCARFFSQKTGQVGTAMHNLVCRASLALGSGKGQLTSLLVANKTVPGVLVSYLQVHVAESYLLKRAIIRTISFSREKQRSLSLTGQLVSSETINKLHYNYAFLLSIY